MNLKTTSDLDSHISRILPDPNRNIVSQDLRMDFMNESIDDLLHILISLHREGIVALQWSSYIFPHEDFSYRNRQVCPNDYYLWADLRTHRDDEAIEIVDDKTLLEDSDTFRGAFFVNNVTPPDPDASNSGTDDLELRGEFTGSEQTSYVIEVQTATTFRWSDDGGSTWDVSDITMTGDWITLNNGIKAKFGSTSGYTAGDKWTFTAYHDRMLSILDLNDNPTTDVELTYARKQDDIASIAATVYLPFPQFYEVLKDLTVQRCRNFNKERVDIDAYINTVARRKAKQIMKYMNAKQDLKYTPRGIDHEDYL